MAYSASELMTVNAARLLRDGDTVFVALACHHQWPATWRAAPTPQPGDDLRGGCNRARPARAAAVDRRPDAGSGANAVCTCTIFSAFTCTRAMGGGIPWRRADRPYGNINATVSRLHHPKTRLPLRGSMEIAAWANRCYIITPHQKRRFPEKVDFRTSAGFSCGRAEREASGFAAAALSRGDQPWHPRADETANWCSPPCIGLTVDQRAKIPAGFTQPRHDSHHRTAQREELRIMREELDPQGFI